MEALLSECHAAYFSARKNLLVSRLTERIRKLDQIGIVFVELVRVSSSAVSLMLYGLRTPFLDM